MGRPAKALSGFNRTVGSNPTLSAKRSTRPVLIAAAVCLLTFSMTDRVGAACFFDYVVKPGDSWWSISRSQGVSVQSLLNLNGARSLTLIRPKERICIPREGQLNKVEYSQDQIEQIIRDVWPDDLEGQAIAIAKRESKLRPNVIGTPNSCCYGLFQIYYRWHRVWLKKLGVTKPAQLLDPVTNARAALELYRRSAGWGPWKVK